MVDFLCAFDLRRVVRKVLIDGEVEVETAAFIHSFIRIDGQGEVENIIRVGERGSHGPAKRPFELRKV